MNQSDIDFFKTFSYVLGALVLFTLFCIVTANLFSPDSAEDPLAVAQQKQAIEPVGKLRIAK